MVGECGIYVQWECDDEKSKSQDNRSRSRRPTPKPHELSRLFIVRPHSSLLIRATRMSLWPRQHAWADAAHR